MPVWLPTTVPSPNAHSAVYDAGAGSDAGADQLRAMLDMDSAATTTFVGAPSTVDVSVDVTLPYTVLDPAIVTLDTLNS
jgi:hypothetical protein